MARPTDKAMRGHAEQDIADGAPMKKGEGLKEPPPQSVATDAPLTREELAKLPPWAAAMIAARCALRVQPLARPSSFDESTRERHVESIAVAIDVAVVLWGDPSAAHPAAAYAAYAVTAVAVTAADADAVDAAAAAAATARAAADAAARVAAYAAAAAAAARAAARATARADADAAHSADAARHDYQLVASHVRETDDDASLRTKMWHLLFGTTPLWPNGEPDGWRLGVVAPWAAEMKQLGEKTHRSMFGEIANSYIQMLDGRGFDFDAAERRVRAWMEREEEKKEATEEPDDAQAQIEATEEPIEQSDAQKKPGRPRPAVGAPTAEPDVASAVDHLGRTALVESLAAMFAAKAQATPFTLALLGNWGSGKSSVVEQIKEKLASPAKGKAAKCPYQFHHATFNAWQYEHTDNIRAGMAQEVIKGLLEKCSGLPLWKLKFRFAWRENSGAILARIGMFATAVMLAAVLLLLTVLFGEVASGIIQGTVAVGLAGLLAYLIADAKRLLDHPLATELTTYLKLPDYGQHLGVVPVMKKHIQTLCELRGVSAKGTHRLIVFVDDLDRCGSKCIIDTLDAVRLVMDIPNVIVVIAIDHRIALRAVARHYKLVADDDRDADTIARDYLGKIVQLSIMLDDPSAESLGRFIRHRLFASVSDDDIDEHEARAALTGTADAHEPAQPEPVEAAAQPVEVDRPPPTAHDGGLAGRPTPEPRADGVGVREDQPPDKGVTAAIETAQLPVSDEERQEAMKETADSLAAFQQAIEAYGLSNPRQIIRLHNTLRLLTQVSLTHTGDPLRDVDLMRAMLFWLEYLNERRPEVRESLEKTLSDGDTTDIAEQDAAAVEAIRSAFEHAGGEFSRYRDFVAHFVLPASKARGRQGDAAKPTTSPTTTAQ